jgi:ubiquinone/menaquinone biosynthesis C-methylase UbiE
MRYSRNKIVLDSCSGIGWGSYLIDGVASQVLAVDIDARTIEVARTLWPTRATHWLEGSALGLALASGTVDIALAMESIEHFSIADIELYLDELWRVLKPGGRLLGSSAFPETREEADLACARNPFHLHICTRNEFSGLLARRFQHYRIFWNSVFFEAEK